MPFTGFNGLWNGVLRGSRPLSGESRERVTLWSGFLGAEATERRLQREGHSLLGVPRGRQSLGGGCRERSLPLGVLRGRQPMSPLTTKAKRVVIVGYNCQANCSLHVRHGWHHIFFFPFVVLLRSGSQKWFCDVRGDCLLTCHLTGDWQSDPSWHLQDKREKEVQFAAPAFPRKTCPWGEFPHPQSLHRQVMSHLKPMEPQRGFLPFFHRFRVGHRFPFSLSSPWVSPWG